MNSIFKQGPFLSSLFVNGIFFQSLTQPWNPFSLTFQILNKNVTLSSSTPKISLIFFIIINKNFFKKWRKALPFIFHVIGIQLLKQSLKISYVIVKTKVDTIIISWLQRVNQFISPSLMIQTQIWVQLPGFFSVLSIAA